MRERINNFLYKV